MAEREGIFAGSNPFEIARRWLAEAEEVEINDPNAIALATVDSDGMPNARMVLLKEIEPESFLFYTNYGSAKGAEIEATHKAAFVLHWKSLRRQIRVRGTTEREDGAKADAYFNGRDIQSRLGAWASTQSQPLKSRATLMAEVAKTMVSKGTNPPRPEYWGGVRIHPTEIEFWADGAYRLHDRFKWQRAEGAANWQIDRLYP